MYFTVICNNRGERPLMLTLLLVLTVSRSAQSFNRNSRLAHSTFEISPNFVDFYDISDDNAADHVVEKTAVRNKRQLLYRGPNDPSENNPEYYDIRYQPIDTIIDVIEPNRNHPGYLDTAHVQIEPQQVCVAHIKEGRIDLALTEYYNLISNNNNVVLSKIIVDAYGNELVNFYNVMKFARRLMFVSQISIAYPVLFDQMKTNKHLDYTEVFSLEYNIKEAIKVPTYSTSETDYVTELQRIIIELSPHIRSSKILAASSITNGKYSQLINLDEHDYKAFEYYIPEIIKLSYLSRSNMKNIIKFIRDVPYIESSGVILFSLYDEMKIHNHLDITDTFAFASMVKNCMDMTEYYNIQPYYKGLFETLKTNFQSNKITNLLVWQGAAVCSLRNLRFNEYLYTRTTPLMHILDRYDWSKRGDPYVYGNTVSTITLRNDTQFNSIFWKFNFIKYFKDGTAFTIQNQRNDGDYLYRYSNGAVRMRHDFKTGNEWILEPYAYKNKTNVSTFKLRKIHNRILGVYPIGYNQEKWREVGVESWKLWDDIYRNPVAAVWQLECD